MTLSMRRSRLNLSVKARNTVETVETTPSGGKNRSLSFSSQICRDQSEESSGDESLISRLDRNSAGGTQRDFAVGTQRDFAGGTQRSSTSGTQRSRLNSIDSTQSNTVRARKTIRQRLSSRSRESVYTTELESQSSDCYRTTSTTVEKNDSTCFSSCSSSFSSTSPTSSSSSSSSSPSSSSSSSSTTGHSSLTSRKYVKRKFKRNGCIKPPRKPNPGGKEEKVLPYILNVQNYMNDLTYNNEGPENFIIRPQATLITHQQTAKKMIEKVLPIKCLEATILGIYLTNSILELGRFPINFKSEIHDKTFNPGRKYYYHVVLGLVYKGRFGAIGLSRKSSLMDKPLKYQSLFDLVLDYKRSYSECCHTLQKVRIGDLVPHREYCVASIPWRGCNIKSENGHNEFLLDRERVDQFGTHLKSKIRFQSTDESRGR